MEKTKLVIRLPSDLLEGARRYARKHNTTVTRLISTYLGRLVIEDDLPADAPTVRRLSGILSKEASTHEYDEYRDHKYGRPT